MSIVIGLRDAVEAQLAAHAPDGVQTSPISPTTEVTARDGSVWVDEFEITSEWHGLGGGAAATHRRRNESGTVTLMALCYREAPKARDAATAAITVVDTIIAGVQAAIEDDTTFGGHWSWARLGRVKSQLWPRENGWTAGAQIVLNVESRP